MSKVSALRMEDRGFKSHKGQTSDGVHHSKHISISQITYLTHITQDNRILTHESFQPHLTEEGNFRE